LFFSNPAFWASVASLFGLLKMFFVYYEKSQVNGANLSASVERLKADNLQKSADTFNGFMARIDPLVLQHEVALKEIKDAILHISVIEKGLRGMVNDVQAIHEDFKAKIITSTASMQLLIDRVNKMDQDLKMKLGTVTRKY
jgi:prophage DNA circulation protein